MHYDEKLKQISDYVTLFFVQHHDPRLFYHNIDHTRDMADKALQIATHYALDEHDRFIVASSALFHDVGYLLVEPQLHELKGAEVAEGWLKQAGVREEDILAITQAILSTKMPQNPSTQLEKIICDADLFHLGKEDFWERSKLLRKEMEALTQKDIGGADWRASTIALMEAHHYHTDYCVELLSACKAKNLAELINRHETKAQEKAQKQIMEAASATVVPLNADGVTLTAQSAPKQKKEKKEKKGKGASRPERGVETMFRITAANQQRLSNQADNKAHIMISVNSIIISVALALIVRKLDENRNLAIPTLILLVMNTITIIYSILATRPKVPTGKISGMISREQIEKQQGNLLFFGDFFKMEFEDYKYGMQKMMENKDYL